MFVLCSALVGRLASCAATCRLGGGIGSLLQELVPFGNPLLYWQSNFCMVWQLQHSNRSCAFDELVPVQGCHVIQAVPCQVRRAQSITVDVCFFLCANAGCSRGMFCNRLHVVVAEQHPSLIKCDPGLHVVAWV
ncbi:hypothetical protein COO60DRAFT_890937 [Scenedesmus sp. NREL 46B-D3]|nr:hypothetical protein COO60DRAFT_890937 [Scenedesmus sp. NREL 46B-D3]